MKVRAARSAVLVATTCAALTAGTITGSAAQAQLNPLAGAGSVAARVVSASTATELTGPCEYKNGVQACDSVNAQIKSYLFYHGDVSGCTFSWRVVWGDGSKATTVTQTSPSDGYVFLTSHKYNPEVRKTYTFSLTGTVTAGSCVVTDGSETFTLLSYVALGDSYSSGTGADDYLRGTGFSFQDGGNECLRSQHSYSELVDKSLGNTSPNSSHSETFVFRACNGAVIRDFSHAQITDDRKKVQAQLSSLRKPARSVGLVTFTIGGNDTMFAPVMNYCAQRTKKDKSCKAKWSKTVDAALASIEPRLVSLYKSVKGSAALAKGAKILVLGYPRFFPQHQSRQCPTGDPFHHFLVSDMAWINTEIQRLDTKIEHAAHTAKITYVSDVGAFSGHELCDKKPYLNSVVIIPLAAKFVESYHPKAQGQKVFAELIEKALRKASG
jgi:lysophospholipase L1-like esterase